MHKASENRLSTRQNRNVFCSQTGITIYQGSVAKTSSFSKQDNRVTSQWLRKDTDGVLTSWTNTAQCKQLRGQENFRKVSVFFL